ncbi:hypothetical protein CRG98_030743 [Punica granatum]|uniref:Stigma-specific STIG1-like protein 1 n=1 Tax=Punica granatum TaxID=22663 RepID=A0A2I0IY79_PUNGR|nr:hypothetical protein CRG98_030743 [Punica granatum]
MKSPNISFLRTLQFAVLVLLTLTSLVLSISNHPNEHVSFLGRRDRLLAQNISAARMTCDKYPRVCRLAKSPGPDCCRKQCVNVSTDRQNCGKCGKKCKYAEICCGGTCVNPSNDKAHCGKCNNPCRKGNVCSYGFCNYA